MATVYKKDISMLMIQGKFPGGQMQLTDPEENRAIIEAFKAHKTIHIKGQGNNGTYIPFHAIDGLFYVVGNATTQITDDNCVMDGGGGDDCNWTTLATSSSATYATYDNSTSSTDEDVSYSLNLGDKLRVTLDGEAQEYVLDSSPYENTLATSNLQTLNPDTEYGMMVSISGGGSTYGYTVVHNYGWASQSSHQMTIELCE